MFKIIMAGLFCALALSGGAALAQTCTAYPYTLTNGTTADANQVMANFNGILTCANSSLAPLASPRFTGNVGVNSVTGGWSGNQKLSVVTDPTNYNGISSYNNGSTGGTAFLARVDYTSSPLMTMYYSTTLIGSITTGGSSTSFNTTSDYRLKTNVEPITDGLSRLLKLQPKRFNWKAQAGQPKTDGFLAHEVQAVVPDAVTGEKDAVNRDGSIKPQQVDYSKLIPLLVAAIKEQQGEIESLKSQISALKSGH